MGILPYYRMVKHFGSVLNVADALKIDQSAVRHWRAKGISAKAAIAIERLTDSKLKAIDLFTN